MVLPVLYTVGNIIGTHKKTGRRETLINLLP